MPLLTFLTIICFLNLIIKACILLLSTVCLFCLRIGGCFRSRMLVLLWNLYFPFLRVNHFYYWSSLYFYYAHEVVSHGLRQILQLGPKQKKKKSPNKKNTNQTKINFHHKNTVLHLNISNLPSHFCTTLPLVPLVF